VGFVNSDGVVVTPAGVSSSGWSATATHLAIGTAEGCAIYYGTVASPPTAPTAPTQPGEIACTD
jgi:hypothetical protein